MAQSQRLMGAMASGQALNINTRKKEERKELNKKRDCEKIASK